MLDLHRIDQCRPKPLLELCLDAGGTSERGAQQVTHAAHDLVQVDLNRRQRLLAGERQQLPHEVAATTGGLQDDGKPTRMRRMAAQLVVQHLRIAADRYQQVVEVMRNA